MSHGVVERMSGAERGSALIVALFLGLIVTGLCTTLLLTSNTNHLIAAHERDRDRALFASKAGLNWGYHLFLGHEIQATRAGTAFDSFDKKVSLPLDGGQFTGILYDEGEGVYRMTATGLYGRGSRTTELVFQTAPDVFNYGFVGFNEVNLHVHAPTVHNNLEINSTIFSNNWVEMYSPLTVNGSVVASGAVDIDGARGLTTIHGSVSAYGVQNDGLIDGGVNFLASVKETSSTPDLHDDLGRPYDWYHDRNSPDVTVGGSGTVNGDVTRHVVEDGEHFRSSLFSQDGVLMPDPELNVIRYLQPPRLDYAAMKAEADLNDPTYFETMFQAVRYLCQKKVTETIGGKTVTTVKVGTPERPEFIYVRQNLDLKLDPGFTRDIWGNGEIKADGLHIEGGIYTGGDFTFIGKVFTSPNGVPDGYDQLRINAMPHCYPAIISYSEPPEGDVEHWTPSDTPPMMSENQSRIEVRSHNVGPPLRYQGPVFINGLTYAEFESHFHRTTSMRELLTARGAQLAYKLHDCDHVKFTYDPAVRCTRFLELPEASSAPPVIVSFRELR